MKRYDPEQAPDPAHWLGLDEQERIALVEVYHRRTRAKLPNRRLHATLHAVVENQLAEGIPVAQDALKRLMAEGLDRHDAIHAIGSIVTEHMWKVMNEQLPGEDLQAAYLRRLAALTAREWPEG